MFGLIFDKAVSTLPYSWIIGGGGLTSFEDSPSPRVMRIEILIRKPDVSEALDRRINQHRLVRSTVINLALISISALMFFLIRLGFSMRLFISFLVLSILFVGFSLFTGKRSAEIICIDLHHKRSIRRGLRIWKNKSSLAKGYRGKSCRISSKPIQQISPIPMSHIGAFTSPVNRATQPRPPDAAGSTVGVSSNGSETDLSQAEKFRGPRLVPIAARQCLFQQRRL